MHSVNGHIVRALTVAGSDSGGGAGIQADLKTFHQFQVYGMSVITAVTAQNTTGVQGIHELPAAFVRQQLESVAADLGADAVKLGMLSSTELVVEVADFLAQVRWKNVIVDPVMVAKGGTPLLGRQAVAALIQKLLPQAMVVAPNLPEAEVLCGYPLDNWERCRQAAMDIVAMGPEFVVIKGGHTPPDWPGPTGPVAGNMAIDMVYSEQDGVTFLASPRVASKKSHGTGCTYSAALAALLAKGASPLQALAAAKAFVHRALASAQSWDVGSGHGPTDHSVPVPDAPEIPPGQFYILKENAWVRAD